MNIDDPSAPRTKDGWVRLSRVDSAGRRAMWARYSKEKMGVIEVCAGREGDDVRVDVTRGTQGDIFDALSIALWVAEDDADGPLAMEPLE